MRRRSIMFLAINIIYVMTFFFSLAISFLGEHGVMPFYLPYFILIYICAFLVSYYPSNPEFRTIGKIRRILGIALFIDLILILFLMVEPYILFPLAMLWKFGNPSIYAITIIAHAYDVGFILIVAYTAIFIIECLIVKRVVSTAVLMKKENRYLIYVLTMFSLLAIAFYVTLFHWSSPVFMKEWNVNKIKPEVSQHILAITANVKGIFVLIKSSEWKPIIMKTKKASDMTEAEKLNFLKLYVAYKVILCDTDRIMANKEKDELIDFIIEHFIPPRKANEMSIKEKDFIINSLRKYLVTFESVYATNALDYSLRSRGVDAHINFVISRMYEDAHSNIILYWIQHYSFEGDFLSQWMLEDEFAEHGPAKMVCDGYGNLYLLNRSKNNLAKYDSEGHRIATWNIGSNPISIALNSYPVNGKQASAKDVLCVISAKDKSFLKISEYDLLGNLIKERNISFPKSHELIVVATLPICENPFKTSDEEVNDLEVDTDGNIYLFSQYAGMTLDERGIVQILDPQLHEKELFPTFLKKGFGNYHCPFGGVGMLMYTPGTIHVSPQNELFLTITGGKPWGTIDAIVFNNSGRRLGYWEWKKENHSEIFNYFYHDRRLPVEDLDLHLAFFENNVFIGRTVIKRSEDAFHEEANYHSFIQKFKRTAW